MQELLKSIEREHQEVTDLLSTPEVARDPKQLATLGKKKTELDAIVARIEPRTGCPPRPQEHPGFRRKKHRRNAPRPPGEKITPPLS